MDYLSDAPVRVRAILFKEEAKKFQKDFNELESNRLTDISLVEDGENVIVTLTNDKPGSGLLLASLKTGLLHYWGWGKRFFEVK